MTNTLLKIKTSPAREFEVAQDTNDTHVTVVVRNTNFESSILSSIKLADAQKLGTALINASGENVLTFDGERREAKLVYGNIIESGTVSRYTSADPELVEEQIKDLIAVWEKLTELKTEEGKKNVRRDELAVEATGLKGAKYNDLTRAAQYLLDKLIEAETSN